MKTIIVLLFAALVALMSSCSTSPAQKPIRNLQDSIADGMKYNLQTDADSVLMARDSAKKVVSHNTGVVYTGAKGGKYTWKQSKTGNWYKRYIKR